jgi:tRNA threonylcarbamoyl adenosine modification protein (Sua5/YciO/YrdC/YwlC family)
MAEHLYTYIDPPNPKHLDQISGLLAKGGVVALPAGASWMFCCDAANKKAVNRIRAMRPDHPKEKPFSLICGSISMATTMAGIEGSAFKLMNRICPGHYTLLLPSSRMLPKLLKNKRDVVGIRIPAEPITLAIVEHHGHPLVASSVPPDRHGHNLTMGFEVDEAFGHAIDMVVDLGDELPGQPTTILDLTGGDVAIIRAGAGPVDHL